MAVNVGDKVPDVEIHTMGEKGPEKVSTGDVLGKPTEVVWLLASLIISVVMPDALVAPTWSHQLFMQ